MYVPAALSEIFFEQLSALRGDPGFLYYSDRYRSLTVPYCGILCLYSQKRAIYIHTVQGEVGPIPKPLDSMAATLPQALFVRVHQSFLVNRGHLRTLNKSTRMTLWAVKIARSLTRPGPMVYTLSKRRGQHER